MFISFCRLQVYLHRISCCCCSCCRPTSAAAEREPSSVALAVESRASALVLRSHYCQHRAGLAQSSFAVVRVRAGRSVRCCPRCAAGVACLYLMSGCSSTSPLGDLRSSGSTGSRQVSASSEASLSPNRHRGLNPLTRNGCLRGSCCRLSANCGRRGSQLTDWSAHQNGSTGPLYHPLVHVPCLLPKRKFS